MNFYYSQKVIDLADILNNLPKKFTYKKLIKKDQRQIFFDTFDNRLLFENCSLTKTAYGYRYCRFSEKPLAIAFSYSKKIDFAENIPEKTVKKNIQKITGVRALLKKFEFPVTSNKISIFNKNGNTVAQISCEIYYLNKIKSGASSLSTFFIEGENKDDLKEIRKWLIKFDLKNRKTSHFSVLLKEIEMFPKPYYYKINQDLKHEMLANIAIGKVYHQLAEVIRYNEEGILNDIDTDFLHDFRVSIRKIRSGLSELKGIMPKEKSADFKMKFEELQRSTNNARDLDVLLLIRSEYEHNLPGEFRSGLSDFFRQAKLERNREYKKLQRFIKSAEYKSIMDEWFFYLENDLINDNNCKNSQLPIILVAKKFIQKKFFQIINIGNKITESSADSDFHRLRIECKKLRYLIEFFVSLFPQENIEKFAAQLKTLQNNLGEYNDLAVQQLRLKTFLDTKTAKKTDIIEASSIGGLITLKHQRQKIVRAEFFNIFNTFNSKENFDLYKKLFD